MIKSVGMAVELGEAAALTISWAHDGVQHSLG
jgi:hypothetical protein